MSGRPAAVSLRTHVPLWRASPRSARPSLERDGVRLVREYVWCGTLPILPIQYARAHIGDFVLSLLALPRAGPAAAGGAIAPEGYLWERTRGAPGGDAAERTFDHGGAEGAWDEVKVWTAVPPAAIREIVTAEEAARRLRAAGGPTHAAGSVYGPPVRAGGRTPYDRWLPAGGAFPALEDECRALLADPAAPAEARVHAALYLRNMGAPPGAGDAGRGGLLELLVAGAGLVDGVVALATGLLARPSPAAPPVGDWLPATAPLLAGEEGRVPDGHLARLVAFACATHRPDQVAAFLAAFGGAAGGPATRTVGRWLPLLVASDGRDAGAVAALAAGGAPCAPVLVAFALGAPHSNGVARGIVASLARMPPAVGTPALVALLRRQRDVRRRARGPLDQALAAALERRAGGAEAALTWVARWGRVYARAAAQRLLDRYGSAAARAEARRLRAQETPAASTGEPPND